MRASANMYSQVADKCSQYKMRFLDSLINVGDEQHSCVNCKHFSNNSYCKIDLYDPISTVIEADNNDTRLS